MGLDPLQYIFCDQIIGDRYSKWIVMLEEFNLEFTNVDGNETNTVVSQQDQILGRLTRAQGKRKKIYNPL